MEYSVYSKILSAIVFTVVVGCTVPTTTENAKIRVVFDTDANNELDDQHALAYLLFNGGTFEVEGVTVNATRGGGRIDSQFAEAERVMRLCGFDKTLPIYKGANSTFDSLRSQVNSEKFDGSEAVDFIIAQANKESDRKLVLLAVGKLTNVALALEKDPSIATKFRLVWLGSNFPDPGEYNLANDTASVNYVAKSSVEFEIVTVRYGKGTGSDVVRITQAEVNSNLRGKGPHIANAVTGRHGGKFTCFGDYSVNLFEHINYNGNPPSRSLFDMVAVAVVKNPSWGEHQKIPGQKLIHGQWIEDASNSRSVTLWQNFDKQKIMTDFYQSMNHYIWFTSKSDRIYLNHAA